MNISNLKNNISKNKQIKTQIKKQTIIVGKKERK